MKYITLILISLLFSCKTDLQLFSKKEGVSTLLNAELIELNQDVLNKLKTEYNVEITVPYKDELINLQLHKQELDFTVSTSSGENFIPTEVISFYGKVKGDPNSLVSICITDKVEGIISSNKYGNITIGKEDSYLIFNALSVEQPDFQCFSKEVENFTHVPMVLANAGYCPTLDIESAYENYVKFGSTQATVNWITSIFSAVKASYSNEGIDLTLKNVHIWTTDDGYSDQIDVALNEIVSRRKTDPNFKANFCQLIRGKTSGSSGGIAYVRACNSQYRFGVSEPYFSFNAYPAYSWTINVVSHELGHTMGSPHTHNCGWVGGAIDGCYTPEGSCIKPPIPIGGGTRMSYCHLTNVGINFSLGSGEQPRNVMHTHLSFCGLACVDAAPTCTDGIKNGTETGIDCGGSCPPCAALSNVAKGKQVFQSTQYSSYTGSNGVDGDMNTFTHTNGENAPYLYLDLGKPHAISQITLYSRKNCCNGIMRNIKVWVLNDLSDISNYNKPSPVYQNTVTNQYFQPNQKIDIPTNSSGRYVKVQCQGVGTNINYLSLAELEVYSGTTVVCKDSTVVSVVKVTRDSTIYSTIKVCK